MRREAKIENRQKVTKALDDLQRAMKVVPSEVLYQPKFTYIWTLSEARFPIETSKKVSRDDAVKEIARAFLQMTEMTALGEFAKALGLTRKESGKANHALVKEGFAERLSVGVYRVKIEKVKR